MTKKLKISILLVACGLSLIAASGALAFGGGEECGYIEGVTAEVPNIGTVTFNDTAYKVCIDENGSVLDAYSTYAWSSQLGPIFFNELIINMNNGRWAGDAYAPLNAYNYESPYGVYFDLSGVSTNMTTGVVSGTVDNPRIGEFDFGGINMDLPAASVTASLAVETFGNVSWDGTPVADGESGYKLIFTIDLPEGVSHEVFGFTGGAEPIAESDLRLDQRDLTGDVNDAVTKDEFWLSNLDDEFAEYTLEITSKAPSSDKICTNTDMDDFEFCSASGHTYTLGEMSLNSSWGRDFDWTVNGDLLDTVDGDAVMNLGESLPFAPLFEIDDFHPAGVMELEDLPALALGESYDFTAEFIRNSDGGAIDEYGADFVYATDDVEFGFGSLDLEINELETVWPAEGLLDGDDVVTGIGFYGVGDLDAGVGAWVNSYLHLEFNDRENVYYPSQYFSFVDRRVAIPADPVRVIGTVSGYADSDGVTVVGDVSRLEIRSSLFARATAAVRGIGAAGGGTVNGSYSAIGGEELMSGSILYFTEDVVVVGGEIDDDVTLIVAGGDVRLEGDITRGDGEFGIIVFEENGVGGNMYIDRSVTDVHATVFLDGSLLSSGLEADRTNQLYIYGSLISENTIGGSSGGNCVLGNGETGNCDDARAQDLNNMSFYQLCYPYGDEGDVDFSAAPENCPGYEPSSYDGVYQNYPVIIEYRAAGDELLIF
ncbi:MAG: hypothetical protein ABII07_05310 [Patescibacteria group bacterium]|nr:hypothetical protein [Patescibacteria group bacterium]